jgi:dienelactone hydrolase
MTSVKPVVKWLLFFCLIPVGAAIWLALGKQPLPLPSGSLSERFLQTGPHAVSNFDITLIDNTRKTSANGDYPGDNFRTLPTTVWHPKALDNGPYPLIIHSHGFSSLRAGGRYLAEHLASLGYFVVAADFPLTNFFAPGGPQVKDVIHQPGDVTFLINTLLEWNTDPQHVFFGKIEPQHIGVMGISLGGMTSTMVAYDPNRRDRRIAAAVSLAGPSNMFSSQYFRTTSIPFMMLATEQDALVNYEENAKPVLDKISNATLVTLSKASHTGFADSARYLRWMSNPDALGCFIVMRNLNKKEKPWIELLGTAEDGIEHNISLRICEQDPLPAAMNPIHQQQLAILAVSSFFQSHFAKQDADKQRYRQYLMETMSRELPGISINNN